MMQWSSRHGKANPRVIALAALFVVICVALVFSLNSTRPNSNLLIVSGVVEAKDVSVGSKVGGRLSALHVIEGDDVDAGSIIAEFDVAELLAQLPGLEANLLEAQAVYQRLQNGARPEEIAQAQARVEGAKARLALLEAGAREEDIAAAKASLDSVEVELQQAVADLTRAEKLFVQGVYSRDRYEHAQAAMDGLRLAVIQAQTVYDKALAGFRNEEIDAAQADVELARQNRSLILSGSRVEDLEAAQARIAGAEAKISLLNVSLGEALVVAPCDGVVLSSGFQPGDILSPGVGVVRLLVDGTSYIQVFIPQDKLSWVQPGISAQLQVDTYPEKQFEGMVSYLATQGEFTPQNLQTKEKRVTEVFRVKIIVNDTDGLLRPGMVCDVVFTRPGIN